MNNNPTTRRSHSGFYTASNKITWSKRELPLLYEDLSYNEEEEVYPRVQDCGIQEQVIISSGIYEDTTNGPIKKQTLYWLTKHLTLWNGEEIGTHESEVGRIEHFSRVDWESPYLLGVQHHNRFKRFTKVLITAGDFLNYHGIVVGHKKDFDILEDSSPIVKVLIGTGQIIEVSQAILFLVDIHNKLPYAIPLLTGFILEEKPKLLLEPPPS